MVKVVLLLILDIFTIHRIELGIGGRGEISELVTHGKYIFVTTSEGKVAKINWQSGKIAWIKEYKNPFFASPSYANGKLVTIDALGIIRIMDAETGRILKEADNWWTTFSKPVVHDETIYILDITDRLCAWNLKLEMLWCKAFEHEKISLLGSSTPLVFNNTIIVGLSSGKIVALSKEGKIVGEENIGTGKLKDVDNIISDDKTLFLTSTSGVFAKSFGLEKLWEFPMKFPSGLARFDGGILVSGEGKVTAFNLSGRKLWETEKFYRVGKVSAYGELFAFICEIGGKLSKYVGTLTRLCIGDVKTGKILGKVLLPSSSHSTPIFLDENYIAVKTLRATIFVFYMRMSHEVSVTHQHFVQSVDDILLCCKHSDT